jgi:hypothetical protein
VWGVGGVRNLCCIWVEFFIKLGFDSPTSCFEFLYVVFFLESWAIVVSFLLNNILGNLICISFGHICHVLKIENWHIHNPQKNLLENKCVTNYYSKIEFLGIHILFCPIFLKFLIFIHKIGVKVDSQTTLVATCLIIFAKNKIKFYN